MLGDVLEHELKSARLIRYQPEVAQDLIPVTVDAVLVRPSTSAYRLGGGGGGLSTVTIPAQVTSVVLGRFPHDAACGAVAYQKWFVARGLRAHRHYVVGPADKRVIGALVAVPVPSEVDRYYLKARSYEQGAMWSHQCALAPAPCTRTMGRHSASPHR